MADSSRKQRWVVGAALAVFLLGIGGAWLVSNHGLRWGGARIAADMPQDEFEQRVRTYLLDHPGVVAEALDRLEAKQGEQAAADARAILKAHTNEVFQDSDDPIGGNFSGDVTLVEFFDYNCPYCRMMAPVMTEAEAADPKLRIVYKEFPILGPSSVFAAEAALAAAKQGKYVAFHRSLYQVRGQVDEAKVIEVAATVGIDVDRMKADMQDATIEAALDKNGKLAQALHITGTPGFVVGEEITTGAVDLNNLQALIGRARDGQQGVK